MAMQSPSSSSSSSFFYNFNYDVFISFRGTDTRYGFTGNLYKALSDKGIRTFIDDKELQRGDEITPTLLKNIETSRIAIIVFSDNYASSSFCLDELVHITHCYKTKGRLVFPIFYGVDPTDVRHQTGSYGEHLAKHEKKFQNNNKNMERLKQWKIALEQVANLAGFHFNFGNEQYEYKFIKNIVTEISNKINRVLLHVADHPVGLDSKLLKVKSLLEVDCDNVVYMIGIYGSGGMGKTTLTKAIYNLIADKFECLCYLHDVREKSIKYGLTCLQEEVLSESIGEKIQLGHVSKGIPMIKKRLQQKKVLLILDDVDDLKQLEVLVGEPGWFGPGSRVIITTRDEDLLSRHGITRIHKVDGLSEEEALELFRWKALKSKQIDTSYDYILNRAVKYASGLPLALEVVGSTLFGKPIAEWESILEKYERIPDKKIHDTFKVSFDALDEEQQSVFLDIACCFKGHLLEEVIEILNVHYGHCIKSNIGVLVDKSLIKISWCQQSYKKIITLHDLIEDMGKEVLRRESPKEPGERSRLWCHDDIVHVLQENTGTSKIEMIYMNFPSKKFVIDWNGKAFKKMTKLKTLIIKNVHFSNDLKYLPSTLRVLKCDGYPLESPSTSVLKKEFKNMKILLLNNWKFLTDISSMTCLLNLKSVSLKGSKMKILPKCLEKCLFLESINLDDCSYLEEISGIPPNLKILSAIKCISLTSSSKSILMSQELHEAGGTEFYFPSSISERIPKWFEHKRREPSISFAFRNKLPSLVFFFSSYQKPVGGDISWIGEDSEINFLIGQYKYHYQYPIQTIYPSDINIIVYLSINGNVYTLFHSHLYLNVQLGYTYLLSFDVQNFTIFPLNHSEPKKIQEFFESMLEEALLKNEWIHAEVNLEVGDKSECWFDGIVVESGLHVIKHLTNKEDFQCNDTLPVIDKKGLSPPPKPPSQGCTIM